MKHGCEVFVGIDVAKARNAIAVADGERGGEVREFMRTSWAYRHGTSSRCGCNVRRYTVDATASCLHRQGLSGISCLGRA